MAAHYHHHHHHHQSFPQEGVREIWLTILDKLDQADKPTFCRTFDQWHEWAAPKRSTFLSLESAPSLVEKLSPRKLITIRELSQSWKQSVDHQSQVHPSNHRFDFEIEAKKTTGPRLFNNFSSTKDIQSFMDCMETHPGNPFPQRNIKFAWKEPVDPSIDPIQLDNACRAFWLNVLQLLEKFGMHIWYMNISFTDSFRIGKPALMESFRNCMLLVPHLQKLEIHGGWLYVTPNVDLNTLPLLTKLKTVVITSCHKDFIDAVLISCSVSAEITHLSIRSMWAQERFSLLSNFVNLEVLEIDISIEELERLRYLERIPPLREINLFLANTESVLAQRVFDALEPFGNSLVNCQINKGLLLRYEDRTVTRINLPILKRLKLSRWHGSLDPLLQINTLNTLEIYAPHGKLGQYDNSNLQFYGFEKHMYNSNIWNLWHSLITIRVKYGKGVKKCYYRSIFNQRQLTHAADTETEPDSD